MMNTFEDKQKANTLRKAGQLKEALALYQKLWFKSEQRDVYIAAGYLHCLRKLDHKSNALKFADQYFEELKALPWGKNELVWTYIQFLFQEDAKARQDISKISATAARLMEFNPEEQIKKIIVMKVLRIAKANKRWDLVNEWALKVDPETLDSKPRKINGKKTWPQRAVWYNCRINGLLGSDDPADQKQALQLSNEASTLFIPQRKFFRRLAARAHDMLGNTEQAALIYKDLCAIPRVDWWIHYEYAKLLQKTGDNGEAITFMCQAAQSVPKTEKLVNLFYDLALLFRNEGNPSEAKAHLLLCKYVREKHNWTVSQDLLSLLQHPDLQSAGEHHSLEEALAYCKKTWTRITGKEGGTRKPTAADRSLGSDFRHPKRGLQGRVKGTSVERPYCFIIDDNQESYFCLKTNLPPGVEDGRIVVFDAIPSFDRKKNIPSWKAANIKTAT